ncbi:hypothetical protein Tco_0894453 [Tanacetum coccineum]|uniref:Protein kinase domain-containing protein n=1 Tax=Tanacetum coccineum TaxID=301880 RepID=A0ABQ5CBR3_9ASTR
MPMHPFWWLLQPTERTPDGGSGGDDDVEVVVTRWRVAASGLGDRIDRVTRSIFKVGPKKSAGKSFRSGAWWSAGAVAGVRMKGGWSKMGEKMVYWFVHLQKVVHLQKIEREMSTLALLNHPNVMRLHVVTMDDPNITIEAYIRLEEEKDRRRGKVFNWQTATYSKIWDNEDVHDLRSVETEFPAIVFNDALTFKTALLCEPTVSSLNNDEIDFRISFDESNDEDCTVIFNKKSFSYKIIYVKDLKTDLENDNDKVNMPLLPSPEPTVSYFDDLDFFKDFENEFPVVVYNDAQTSNSDLLIEPILSPQHIDEFNKDEASLSECDEEEQNVLNFNDLFSFNVIYPDELKTDKDNEDDKIDIEHSLGDLSLKPLPDIINTDVGAYAQGSNKLLEIRMPSLSFKNLYRAIWHPVLDPNSVYKDGIKLGKSNLTDFL